MNARHRHLIHAVGAGETPLLMAKNFLDVYSSEFGARPGEARTAIGVQGGALPLGLQSQLWEKYELGRTGNITDMATSEPAKRNIYINDTDLGINRLMERGVLLLVCNQALKLTARRLATARSLAEADVHAELRAGVLPGAVIVPALVIAVSRAQERGFTYIRAS